MAQQNGEHRGKELMNLTMDKKEITQSEEKIFKIFKKIEKHEHTHRHSRRRNILAQEKNLFEEMIPEIPEKLQIC